MKRKRITLWNISIVLLSISCMSCSEKKTVISKDYTERDIRALKSSAAWLKLVDSGDYSKSWYNAAEYFKNAVGREQWQNSLNSVRKPLGKVIARTVKDSKYYTSLPGAPDGEYVVIQYKTSFKKKKSSIETITPMKDKDGRWRVSGYYIK